MIRASDIRLTPIIKAVGSSCNLRCGYCFYDGQQACPLTVMDTKTLETVTRKLMGFSPHGIQFIWHGGEPLMAGLNFYQTVVDIQSRFQGDKQPVRNTLQTNGTLVNNSWVSFFNKHDFKVGISIDGPEEIHDHIRINASGQGSFNRVMRGYNLLLDGGIKPGIIAVINSYSVQFPTEIFEFFHGLGANYSANECVAYPEDHPSMRALAVSSMDYYSFLLQTFDLWLKTGDKRFRVKPITDFVQALMGQRPKLCKFRGLCHNYITVDVNGDVYPCSAYLREGHCLGNLVEQEVEELVTSNRFQNYYAGRAEVIALCGDCKWLPVCNGCCMRTWGGMTTITSLTEHSSCEGIRFLLQGMTERLKTLGYAPKILV